MSLEVALLGGLLLLIANAFFVGAEFSMISVRRSSIEPMAARGSKRALTTLRALENLSLLMAGAQLGITLCSLALGAIAKPAFAHMLEGPFQALNISENMIYPLSFAVALAVTVFLHVVIGEMVPKNYALAKPEGSALLLTPTLVKVVKVLGPIVILLNWVANHTLRLMGIQPKAEVSSTYTRDEVADLVRESREEGYLSKDNEYLLSGALAFEARTVRDIAMPVEKMVMTDKNKTTYADIENLSIKTGFSRFPVTSKKKEIVGYIHIKDVLETDEEKRGNKVHGRYIRKLVTVNAGQSIRMTLKVMQRSGAHIALVTNGQNKLVGLVTMEDVLEELVGEMSQSAAEQAVNKTT